MATRNVKTLLQWESKGQQAVVAANKQVGTSLSDIRKTADAAYERRVSQINAERDRSKAAFADIRRAADAAYDTRVSQLNNLNDIASKEAAVTAEKQKQVGIEETLLQKYRERGRLAELDRIVAAGPSDAALGIGGGGRTRGEAVSRFGRQIFNAPAVGPSTPIARALITLGPLLDKPAFSLGNLGKAAAIATPALVGVALAVEAFNQQIAASKRLLEAALNAQKTYYAALASATTEQAQQQVEELRRTRPLLEQQLQETRDSIISAFGDETLTDPLGAGRLQRGLAKLIAPELFEQLDAQGKALEENIQSEARLTQGLEENAFAGNDAAAAVEAHTEALRRAREQFEADLRASTEAEADLRVRLAGIRRNGTSEQIQEELAANRDREEILRNFLIPSITDLGLSAEETAEKTKPYRDELNNLLHADELLLQAVLPIIDAREREAEAAQAITDQTDAYFKALELEGKARDALIAATQKEAADREAHAQKILAIQTELAEKEAELWRKAGEDTLEAEAKAYEARVKQEQQYYKQVQDIQRRANATIANAVFARDALVAYLAAQQRDEDLRKAKEDNDERLKQIDDALEDQKKVIAKRLDEQLKAQRKAADDAIRTEMERRRREAEINQRAIQEALVAYQNAAYATQQIALFGSNGRRIIETQLWQDINSIAVTWAFNTANTLRSILGGGSSGGSSQFPPLIGGGSAGSGVLPSPLSTTRTGGGVTVNIGVNAKEFRNVSKQEAINLLGRILEA